jgi:putative DNA primase/helicase
MVARAMHPGCKVDTLPVFEGDQGAGKSSGLRILGGKLFTECHEQITSKDFYSVLSGRWLVEISEMHSFNKAEVERIKGIISNQTDRYRLPYDRHASDHPRQCVFAGTTNRDDWHSDETGGRRFWPVACGTVNQVWLRENREQLFAEAFVRYQRGESWWDVPSDQQREKIEDRRQEDAWTAPIARFLENRSTVSLSDVLRDGIQKPIEHHTPNDTRRVAKILRDLNFENYSERVAGVKKRMWRKKSNPPLHE